MLTYRGERLLGQPVAEARPNLRNFVPTLAMPKAAQPWSLTSLREKLIKIGAKVVSYITPLRRPPKPA